MFHLVRELLNDLDNFALIYRIILHQLGKLSVGVISLEVIVFKIFQTLLSFELGLLVQRNDVPIVIRIKINHQIFRERFARI